MEDLILDMSQYTQEQLARAFSKLFDQYNLGVLERNHAKSEAGCTEGFEEPLAIDEWLATLVL